MTERATTWLTSSGFAGQAIFTSARFLVQWLESERRCEPVVPVAFWWLQPAAQAGLFLL